MPKLDPIQRQYVSVHRAAIRALLALEARAKRALAGTLRRELAVAREDVLSAIQSNQGDRAKAAAAIGAARRAAATMAANIAGAVMDARLDARVTAQREAVRQLRLVARLARADGHTVSPEVELYLHNAERIAMARLPQHVVQLGGITTGGTIDETMAGLAGKSVAARFERETLASALDWQSTGLVLTAWIRETQAKVEQNARNMAVEHTAHAFADEVDAETHRFFTETISSDDDWAGNVFKAWSSVLDRKTCSYCWSKDGQIIRAADSWPGPGPGDAHRFCRCFEATFYVPDEQKRKLPGIVSDYKRFKEDVAETGGKERYEALPYITDSLKATSPETLTRRLADRQARGH